MFDSFARDFILFVHINCIQMVILPAYLCKMELQRIIGWQGNKQSSRMVFWKRVAMVIKEKWIVA